MHYFEAESRIDAPATAVWPVLTDIANWPAWDSGVEGVEGTLALGNTITIRSAAAPGRTFPVKVIELTEPSRMVFSGGMPLGLFRGVRTYSLESAGGGTLVRMREEYTGALLGLIWRSIPDLAPSFAQFTDGLKQRVEAAAVAGS